MKILCQTANISETQNKREVEKNLFLVIEMKEIKVEIKILELFRIPFKINVFLIHWLITGISFGKDESKAEERIKIESGYFLVFEGSSGS